MWYSVGKKNDFCSGDDCIGCKNLIDFDSAIDEILVYNDIVCIVNEEQCYIDDLGNLLPGSCNGSDDLIIGPNTSKGYFNQEQLMDNNLGQSISIIPTSISVGLPAKDS